MQTVFVDKTCARNSLRMAERLFYYNIGLIRPTEAFFGALAAGKETTWSDQYMRMVPEFIVGGEKYAWLNESIFVAEGRLAGPKEIEYLIYRVT